MVSLSRCSVVCHFYVARFPNINMFHRADVPSRTGASESNGKKMQQDHTTSWEVGDNTAVMTICLSLFRTSDVYFPPENKNFKILHVCWVGRGENQAERRKFAAFVLWRFFLLRRSYEYSPTSLPVVNSFSWLDVHKKMGSFTGDYGQTVSVCQLIGYKLMMGYFSLGIMNERW